MGERQTAAVLSDGSRLARLWHDRCFWRQTTDEKGTILSQTGIGVRSSGTARAAVGRAGPDDAVFTLNSQTGRIRFGDGINGAIPPVGSTVAVSYRQGGGSAGNISRKIYDATDVMQFRAIVRDRAQILGWGNRRV